MMCLLVNAGPLTSADLMGEASGEGLRVSLFLVGSLAANC